MREAATEEMARPGQGMTRRRQPWVVPGDGVDHITGLPMELRAHIASFLPSRPWRRIHDHMPVVHLKLDDFLSVTDEMLDEEDDALVPLGILDEDALASLKAALLRRDEQGAESSKVDVLRISYSPDDLRIRRHADRIVALADAREIRVEIPKSDRVAWALRLPPSTRDVEVVALHYLVPTIDGPRAAALQTLRFENVVVSHWPTCLPSLLSLTLDTVTIEAPFPPGAWCPLLEDLRISVSDVVPARMDIRLPLLKTLELDDVTGPLMDVRHRRRAGPGGA